MLARTMLGPLALSLLAAAPAAQATVWEVATDGSGDFSEISQAVAAASDGDVIFVRDGQYLPFTIDGKSLTIHGEDEARTVSFVFTPGVPAIRVRNLAADQVVVLRDVDGLSFGSADFDYGMRIQNCAGTVVLEECYVANLNGRAAEITGSDAVVLRDCTIDALEPAFSSFSNEFFPRTGLTISGSRVELHDCTVWGTRGQDSLVTFQGQYPAIDGGTGVSVTNGELLAFGCNLVGGQGGEANGFFCSPGGDGAPGLLATATATVTVQGTSFTGGPGGLSTCGSARGVDAPATELNGASFTVLPGDARLLVTESPVVEGTSVTIDVTGTAGDLPLLVVGPGPAPAVLLPQVPVALTTSAPWSFLALPTLDASGASQEVVPLPLLPPSAPFTAFVAQTAVLSTAGTLHATAASTTLVLAIGF